MTAASTEPRLERVACLDPTGLRRVAYWEWGDPENPRVVVCVHGLTRQGRDFDVLARALADDVRVVCPDVAGRGESDRLADPSRYALPTYVADMVTLLARVRARHVSWVGTSMGGLIGLGLAALPGTPVRRLVLNDVGPAIDAGGLARIAGYVGQSPVFASEAEATAYMAALSVGFGPHSPEQWQALSRPMLRRDDAGWRLHYDPAIAIPLRALDAQAAAAGEQMLWAAYDAIRCPTLVLRGSASDVLTPATARAMAERGPRARVHEVPGVGHAPTLVQPDQVAVVRAFLREAAQEPLAEA